MSEKDKIQEIFVKNDLKISVNSLKIVYQNSKKWDYAAMCYRHIGTVTAMCDQYSQ